jgi:hypothetical protein
MWRAQLGTLAARAFWKYTQRTTSLENAQPALDRRAIGFPPPNRERTVTLYHPANPTLAPQLLLGHEDQRPGEERPQDHRVDPLDVIADHHQRPASGNIGGTRHAGAGECPHHGTYGPGGELIEEGPGQRWVADRFRRIRLRHSHPCASSPMPRCGQRPARH